MGPDPIVFFSTHLNIKINIRLKPPSILSIQSVSDLCYTQFRKALMFLLKRS